ncbi:rhomboid family intramembrane serine protease [Robertkochia marina]|uniref:Rhomboid family intramembrane serine protease n=1 Tax=Robertkochia marina TaxID=1227945 RepID=A0A4V3UXZ2_9FLAO|nr:rhomboid family intramembrane serine protease [Robertkochia marina]THD66584.1 rhomboid family intramembrane serine protease [Robertkochia marina]TRZ45577.1 rhomboid family intramembrane serine protease [Robertkochia marina]
MSVTKDLQYKFSRLNIAEKLIVINVVIYIVNTLLAFLFGLDYGFLMRWFELPKAFGDFIVQPWSVVTYSFFHGGIWHVFWNMLLLYFSGRIFLNLFSAKTFINVYFLGAIAGGLVFLLSYNVFPVFSGINTSLIGASAAVMAVLLFVCTYLPNQEVRVIFFNVKLWYIGVFVVLLDLIQLPMGNSGGHLAHLGGELLGFLYAKKLMDGKDIGEGFGNLIDRLGSSFSRRKRSNLKTVHRSKRMNRDDKPSKQEYQKHIDAILDKISKSGYESLTKEEKDFLFKAGKED